MLLPSFLVAALAGVVSAATPPNFQPATSSDLIIAFGDTLAIDGVDLPKASTQTAPTVGTAAKLVGTYTLLMVDPDIPAAADGSSRGQLLHWMQTDLVSSDTRTTVAGRQFFALVNPDNTTAIASYRGPSPPAQVPFSHRYISMLVNTTADNATVLATLTAAGQTRLGFNAQSTLANASLSVLAGGWFNVTNTSTPTTSSTASGSGSSTPTGSSTPSSTPLSTSFGSLLMAPGAVIAGFGVLAALFL